MKWLALNAIWCVWCVCVYFVRATDISMNAFGDDRDGLPAAFGDFNSDGLIDVFITRQGGKVFQVLLAMEKEPLLKADDTMKCEFDLFNVTSVVPGDFDGDAFMDIMLTTQDEDLKPLNLYDIRIIWGGGDKFNCSSADQPMVSRMKGHPLALDYDRNMIIDLFGMQENGTRTFWVFNHDRTVPIAILERGSEMRIPHSNSFLDLNGDYIADLVIITMTAIEIWFGKTDEPGFEYNKSYGLIIGPLEGHIGQALFLDVELSGELYLLLPLCYDSNCYNSTILLYDDGEIEDRKWQNLLVKFEDDNNNLWGFHPPDNEIYTDSITMRGGDYNMDGYPDLLVTLMQRNGDVQSVLMENVPCKVSACTFKRTYKVIWNALLPFNKATVLSAFYDFYQDGILDYIIVQKNFTTNTYEVGAVKNNLDYDANFIKVMVLTGLKNVKQPTTIGPLGKKKGTYGTNLPGPRISYNTLSQDGLRRDGVCAQLPQSAYYSLNLPYSIFGLGQTPNFVDTLTVGLSYRSKTWTQLIPNSQIVVIPWPPEDPTQWKVQLFVTPSKVIFKSGLICSAICILISLFALFLHWKEKRDDRLAGYADEAEATL